MRMKTVLATIIVLSAAFTASAVQAGSASPWMKTGSRTSQPIGHYDFCKRHTQECNISSKSDAALKLTPDTWRKIIAINNHVNTAIEPRTDMEVWGQEEYWEYPTKYGDCDDYMLLKRRMLIEAGIPASNLLMTVVRQKNGEGHAVLTVRTDRGDFILDNLEQRVLAWNETNYDYLKRQSTRQTGTWVSIDDDREMLVGSISK